MSRGLLITIFGLAMLSCASRPAPAEEAALADVVSVVAHAEAGAVTFEVGVESPDTGCERYADWWEVVDSDGHLIYRRILRHSHVDEQPFVRSGGPVDVDEGTTLWVRAHMHPTGYGGKAMMGSVRAGFVSAGPEPGFAEDLADEPPLPEGCAF
jgi:hypothetical protein